VIVFVSMRALANNFTEKNREIDNLTPLDARNSLLMDPQEHNNKRSSFPVPFGPRAGGYDAVPLSEQNTAYQRPEVQRYPSDQGVLLADASTFGRTTSHTHSMSSGRNDSPGPIRDPEQGYHNTGFTSNAPWQPQQPRGNQSGYAY
jgi:hypothetical protein